MADVHVFYLTSITSIMRMWIMKLRNVQLMQPSTLLGENVFLLKESAVGLTLNENRGDLKNANSNQNQINFI